MSPSRRRLFVGLFADQLKDEANEVMRDRLEQSFKTHFEVKPKVEYSPQSDDNGVLIKISTDGKSNENDSGIWVGKDMVFLSVFTKADNSEISSLLKLLVVLREGLLGDSKREQKIFGSCRLSLQSVFSGDDVLAAKMNILGSDIGKSSTLKYEIDSDEKTGDKKTISLSYDSNDQKAYSYNLETDFAYAFTSQKDLGEVCSFLEAKGREMKGEFEDGERRIKSL